MTEFLKVQTLMKDLNVPFHLDLVIPSNSVSHAQSRRFAPFFVAVETYKQKTSVLNLFSSV